MIIRICAFTDAGRRLADRIEASLSEHVIECRREEQSLRDWTKEAFDMHVPIVYIGACGIAVRAIAPFVKDKLSDSPVIVLDEGGEFVIPILSGHMGGANALAGLIAERLHAQAVLTTATDVNHMFSVDVFAQRNGLTIHNREGIKKVSTKLLREGRISMVIAPGIRYEKEQVPKEIEILSYGSQQGADVVIGEKAVSPEGLLLIPKKYVLGIGCKKDTSAGHIQRTVETVLLQNGIVPNYEEIAALASIDLKAKEYGLLAFAAKQRLPVKTYSTEELLAVPGEFARSEFVESVTGVSNVCERAAICCAGEGARLLIPKTAKEGVTVALAERTGRITEWKM